MITDEENATIAKVDVGVFLFSVLLIAYQLLNGTFFPNPDEKRYKLEKRHFCRKTLLFPCFKGNKGPLVLSTLRGYIFMFTWTVLLYDTAEKTVVTEDGQPWMMYLTRVSYLLLGIYFTLMTAYCLKYHAYEDRKILKEREEIVELEVHWYDKVLWVMFELVWSSAVVVVLGFWGK
jgi:hypothetical protein